MDPTSGEDELPKTHTLLTKRASKAFETFLIKF